MRYRMLAGAMIAALLSTATPSAAHAQFGKLLKKAKDKVSGEASTSPATSSSPRGFSPGSPEFGGNVVELNAGTLDRVMRGMTAELAELRRTYPARKRLSDSLVALTTERNALLDAHGSDDAAVTKWQDAHNNFENCMDEAIPKLMEGHRAELQQRAMSSEVRQQQAVFARQMMAAVQASDSVTMHKLQGQMMALMNPWGAKDSAAALKQCGGEPTEPAWHARTEQLARAINATSEQLRAAGDATTQAALAATGTGSGTALTPEQYALALERIQGYLEVTGAQSLGPAGSSPFQLASWRETRAAGPQFSPAERRALDARVTELRKLFADLVNAGLSCKGWGCDAIPPE
jgi:hypothetical protein